MGDVTKLPRGAPPPPDDKRCARIKTNGERCEAWAVKGMSHCVTHNGSRAKRTQAGFKRNRAKAAAIAYSSKILDREGLTSTPEEHLVDTLVRVDGLVRLFGEVCARLDEIGFDRASGFDSVFRGQLKYTLPDDPLDVLDVSLGRAVAG